MFGLAKQEDLNKLEMYISTEIAPPVIDKFRHVEADVKALESNFVAINNSIKSLQDAFRLLDERCNSTCVTCKDSNITVNNFCKRSTAAKQKYKAVIKNPDGFEMTVYKVDSSIWHARYHKVNPGEYIYLYSNVYMCVVVPRCQDPCGTCALRGKRACEWVDCTNNKGITGRKSYIYAGKAEDIIPSVFIKPSKKSANKN